MNIQIVGCTNGEGIEWIWLEVNVMANSTKEMGPGNWFDWLDEQFACHNWKKICRIDRVLLLVLLNNSLMFKTGVLFTRKHVKARGKAARHMSTWLALSEVLPDKEFKSQWTAKIEAWKCNQELPSPYMIEIKCKHWCLLYLCWLMGMDLVLSKSIGGSGHTFFEGGGM